MKERKQFELELELENEIAERAINTGAYSREDKCTCMIDIHNASKFFNMRLEEWLNADDFDFLHDIIGIRNAINRREFPATFDKDPLFVPRFAGRKEK